MLSIGEFSRVSRLTVKTLRYYHDIGLLLPDKIDDSTGYRFYGPKALDKARAIISLKDLGFSLNDIQDIFCQCREEKDLDSFIRSKIKEVETQLFRLNSLKARLKQYRSFYQFDTDSSRSTDVTEKIWGPVRAAGIRIKGRYDEMGSCYRELYRTAGKWITGKAFCLFFDSEYRDTDAEFMPCVGIRRDAGGKNIQCFDLPEKKAVTSLHEGPYESLSTSYSFLFQYCRGKGYTVETPSIEQYLRGPGIIFRGNPDHYLTEIILFIR